jgi:toxin YoeB
VLTIVWSKKAYTDYKYWGQCQRAVMKRINKLIDSIQETHFQGLGKPEPLKHQLTGYWSRRIDQEHRLIYKIDMNKKHLQIISCKDPY